MTVPTMTTLTAERLPVPPTALARFADRWADDRRAQFWTLQIAGWAGLCLVTFVSLTLWYNTLEAAYVGHTVLQAALGLGVSLGMRTGFRASWGLRFAPRLCAFVGIVVLASLAWTACRIETFMALTGEASVWSDFGGWYFASFLVMLSWALAYHGIRYYQLMLGERERASRARAAAAQERLARLTAERAAQDAHLRMLRYQLNPHFLFNTLNSVTALVETERGAAATEMIGQLSRFLRASLREDVSPLATLGGEIDTIRDYLAIEATRFGERLSVVIDVEPQAAAAPLPSLLLQPLVENSVKHAVARSPLPVTLTVSARADDDYLRIEVADTGPPPRPDDYEGAEVSADGGGGATGVGIGLANVRKRLEATWPQAAFETGPAAPGGWRTVISLPLRGAETNPGGFGADRS